MKKQYAVIILVIFAVLSAVFFAMQSYMPDYHFTVLEVGNVVMAALCLSSFYMVSRQVGNRPQAFIRGVYSASFLKLMVCMVSILVYVLLNRVHIHKPSVFVLFGIYIVYTSVETWLLQRIVRE